jgi:hypothetical protein
VVAVRMGVNDKIDRRVGEPFDRGQRRCNDTS